MKRQKALLIVGTFLLCVLPFRIASANEDPVHDELRALRAQVIETITKGDIEATIRHVHPNIVITWQNGEVVRGIQGLRDYFQRVGKDAFKGYKLPPTPDELTILYGGDTGVSFGRTVAEYNILGKHIEATSRWTATLVKENGHWMLAAYHVSVNALDNPILNAATHGVYWIAGVVALVGLLIGWLFGRRKRV